MRPPARASRGIGQPVRVEVEQREPPAVLGHEDERGRDDGVGHAQARPRRPWPGGSCRPRGRPTGRPGRRPRRPTPSAAPSRLVAAGSGQMTVRLAWVDGGHRARVAEGQPNRSRSPSATAMTAPSSRRTAPASRCTPPAKRRSPSRPAQVPSRPACSPARTRTRSAGGVGDGQVGGVEHEHRRVGDDGDLATHQPVEDGQDRARQRSAERAVEDEHGERRQSMEGGPLARLRGQRSRAAPCSRSPLTMTPRTPIARARVRVSASIRDPTTRMVPANPTSRPPERSSPSLPVATWSRPRVGSTQGHDAAHRPAAGPDDDRRAGSHLADDARDRALDGLGELATGDAPATPPVEQQLALRDATARLGRHRVGDRDLHETRVAQPLRDRGAGHHRLAGRDQGAVTGRQRESDLDVLVDDRALPDQAQVTGHRLRVLGADRPAHSRDPAHSAVCQAASRSRRRSARSGRRSGTSRRSTRRPLRPPPTSMAKWRPRVPRRTVSRNRNSAVASLARRQVHELQAAGHQIELRGRAARVDDETARGAPGSQPGRRHDAAERRQEVVGEIGHDRQPLAGIRDRAQRPQEPGVVEGVLARAGPADDVDDGQGHGRGRHGRPDAARGDHEVRGRVAGPIRGRRREPHEGGPGCGHAQRGALARGVRPRGDAQLAHSVAQAMSVRRDRRPDEDAVDDGVVGVVRRDRSGRHDGDTCRPVLPTGRWRRPRPHACVVAQDDGLDPPVQHVGEGLGRRSDGTPRVIDGEGELQQQVGERTTVRRIADAVARPGRARPHRAGRRRPRTTASPSDMAPASTTGRVGRRVATAATSAASSRIAPRSSARGGSPAPARMASTSGPSRSARHRQGIGRFHARGTRSASRSVRLSRRGSPACVRSRPRWRGARAAGCGPRGAAAGRSARPRRPIPTASASSGSAARIRRPSRSMARSASPAAGWRANPAGATPRRHGR